VIAHRGGRWGFLSWTGEIVVPAEYVSVGTYREGHAAVRTDHGYGFIDRSGKMAIRPRFLRARYFQEGLCPVQEANKRFGFIDKRGDMVIPAKYDEVGNFYGGLAPVKIQEKYGYINMLGEFVIRATFASASDFTADGLARVCVGRSAFSGKVGFIDRRGDWGIEPQFNFEDVGHFREGLARVLCEGGFGYMDTSGNIFIPGRYRQCFDFSEGLAGVDCGIGDTEFGVIDKTGKMVIEPRLGAVFLPFDGGLSQVQVSSREGDKIGYVDKAGTWVWPPTK
ncbi:MAG: WG repeat-containing protein, partial [Actinobacteria bacterium]|nr:WG repeat-containing protein [Actinomycetota bacterium]